MLCKSQWDFLPSMLLADKTLCCSLANTRSFESVELCKGTKSSNSEFISFRSSAPSLKASSQGK